MSIVGMVFYLSAAGFNPEHLKYNPDTYTWDS